MRIEKFVTGELYHIYNRGVDRKNIFFSEDDAQRFVESIRVFNSTIDIGESTPFKRRCLKSFPFDQQLVRIHQFAMLPNHFHFILQQVEENGITRFMHRLGTSYSKYFNKEQERSGYLFESEFKAKLIDSQAYLDYLIQYIHLNPLNLIRMNWKTDGITDKKKAEDFLTSYPWSSLYSYFNSINQPAIDLSLLQKMFTSPKEHLKYLMSYKPLKR